MSLPTLKQALTHFEVVDPQLFELHQLLPAEQAIADLKRHDTASFFSNLCESIFSQQLSTKVADVIWARFINTLPNQSVEPNAILALKVEEMRAVGLSGAKQKYLKNLAETVANKQLLLDQLIELPNEEVIEQLTVVKGIGRWTAEMFMMFTLGRPDIFSFGDLGLRNALKRWYQVETLADQEKIVEKWQPYRTYAARILWNSLTLPN